MWREWIARTTTGHEELHLVLIEDMSPSTDQLGCELMVNRHHLSRDRQLVTRADFADVAQAGAARLVAPGDPAALREALAELIGDPQARAVLSAGARALAGGEWSWQRTAERTKALYSSLLS